jgi:hypothetical protein
MKRANSTVEEGEVHTEISKENSMHTHFNTGPWSIEEHNVFLKAIKIYGNAWKKVQVVVKTRSCSQVRMHFSHYLRKLRPILRHKLVDNINSKITFPNLQRLNLAPRTRGQFNEGRRTIEEKRDNSKVIEQLVIEELESVRANEAIYKETADTPYYSQNDLIVPLENYLLQEYLKGNLSLAR